MKNYKKAPKRKKLSAGTPDSGSKDNNGATKKEIAGAIGASLPMISTIVDATDANSDFKDITRSTMTGASAGAMFGPWGLAIGGGAGLITGAVMAGINKRKMRQAQANANAALQKSLTAAKLNSSSQTSLEDSDLNIVNSSDDLKKLAQPLKSGGTVVGPGGPKDDKVKGNLPKGSFVVPAENAAVADYLRNAFLPKKAGVASVKGEGEPVAVSNGEHIFTPEEKQKLKRLGVNLDALAPNASPDNKLAPGGEVKSNKELAKRTTSTGNKALDKLVDEAIASGDPKKIKEAQDKVLAYDENANRRGNSNGHDSYTQLGVALSNINAVEKGKAQQKQAIADNTDAYNNQYKVRAMDLEIASAMKKGQQRPAFQHKFNQQYLKVYNSAKSVIDNPADHTADEIKQAKQKMSDLTDVMAFVKKSDVTSVESFNNLSKLTNPGVSWFFGNTKDDAPAPATKSSNPVVKQVSNNIPLVTVDAAGNLMPATNAAAKTTSNKVNGPVKRKDVASAPSIPAISVFGNEIIPTGPKASLALPKGKEQKDLSIPANTTPDNYVSNTDLPAFNFGKEDKKDPNSEHDVIEKIGGPAALAALGQVGVGVLANIGNVRPVDSIAPESLVAYAQTTKYNNDMKERAGYGFTDTEMAQIMNNLESNRVQASNTVLGSGTAGGNLAMVRQLAQDKNKAVVDATVQSASFQDQKIQQQGVSQQMMNAVADGIAQKRRKLFEDDLNDYMQTEAASSELIRAGITNYIGIKNLEADRKARIEREKKANADPLATVDQNH